MEVCRKFTPIVIVHGGTWGSSGGSARAQRRRRAAEEAVRDAYAVLMSGGSCVDAVETAVSSMEDCQTLFRVGGLGASANAIGEVETDAIITEGRRSMSGAVFAVQNVANPVKAARAVMDKTQHIMFSGRPASEFAHSCGYGRGVDATSNDDAADLDRPERKKQLCLGSGHDAGGSSGTAVPSTPGCAALERRRSSLRLGSSGTSVGAIAIDTQGRVACASSCSGASLGLPGRVNDAAVLGLGVYAMHRVGGAVACCRGGEQALARSGLAYAVCRNMQDGASPQEAARMALREAAGCGEGGSAPRLGVIALNKAGEFGVYFSAGQMPWAAMTDGQVMSGLTAEFDVTADVGVFSMESVLPSSALPHATVALRQPVMLVHGGAGSWDVVRGYELDTRTYYDGVKAAARAGYEALCSGASALDAVVAAVRYLEDDATFNAGRGSRYTVRRTVEMDAMVMDGRNGGRSAGVATVRNVRNPVVLAKTILETMGSDGLRMGTPTLLVDAGAVTFAKRAGLELAEDSYFESTTSDAIFAKDSRLCSAVARRGSSEKKRRRSQQLPEQPQLAPQRRYNRKQATICVPSLLSCRSAREIAAPYDAGSRPHDVNGRGRLPSAAAGSAAAAGVHVGSLCIPAVMASCDTVGAVALDAYGNVACATSTGGKNYKLSGRVGDSPIVGCGGYADNAVGAISTTGTGEFIARSVLARAVMDKIKTGVGVQDAAVETIRESTRRLGHFSIGVVAVDKDGNPAIAFNTEGMSWAMVKECRLTYGIQRDDVQEAPLEVMC